MISCCLHIGQGTYDDPSLFESEFSSMDVQPKTIGQVPHKPEVSSGLWRFVYIVLGFLFLALGYVGWFLPGVPWTPFVLLASLCFGKSSPRLDAWLLNNRYFGAYLHDVRQHRGVRRHMKIKATVTVCMVVTLSVTTLVLTHRPWYTWVAIPPLALVGLVVLWRGLRTLPNNGIPLSNTQPTTTSA